MITSIFNRTIEDEKNKIKLFPGEILHVGDIIFYQGIYYISHVYICYYHRL